MIVTTTLSDNEKLTDEEINMIEDAKKYPITYDEDSPEMTPEMEKQFQVAVRMRNRLLHQKEA
jgi:hypothetical protein